MAASREGRCLRHAGLRSTEAQRAHARKAAITHGGFVKTMSAEEQAVFDEVSGGGMVLPELRRALVGSLVVRLQRMMDWESAHARDGAFTPMAAATLTELRQHLAALEHTAADRAPIDQGELSVLVEEMLARNPEVLLVRLPRPIQEAMHKAYRQALAEGATDATAATG
jgi:hypothetical protein